MDVDKNIDNSLLIIEIAAMETIRPLQRKRNLHGQKNCYWGGFIHKIRAYRFSPNPKTRYLGRYSDSHGPRGSSTSLRSRDYYLYNQISDWIRVEHAYTISVKLRGGGFVIKTPPMQQQLRSTHCLHYG